MSEQKLKDNRVEVVLADGSVLYVHAPRIKDMGKYTNAMPALLAIGRQGEAIQQNAEGVLVSVEDIDEAVLDKLYPFIASVADITTEDAQLLSLYDLFGIMEALNILTPPKFRGETASPSTDGTPTSAE